MNGRFINKEVKAQIIFWLAFSLYELAVVYSVNGRPTPFIEYIVFFLFNISFFYLHATIVFQTFRSGHYPYIAVLLITAGEILVYLLIKKIIIFSLTAIGYYASYPKDSLEVFIRNSVWRAIYFIGLGTAYAFVKLTIESRRRIVELDRQTLDNRLQQQQLQQNLLASENALLKAQINPHFIFNTLGFLANEVAAFSEKTEELLISFADIFRYAITPPEQDGKVYLRSEIEHLENYLRLNEKRFAPRHHLQYSITGQAGNLRILPLIFMTAIENIYKYAELSDVKQPAKVMLIIEGRMVLFQVCNKKAQRRHQSSYGIGMQNIMSRLQSAYPEAHRLTIEQDDQSYQLTLNLNL